MFRTTDKNGFHMRFINGWTVSVQFGPGNYTDEDVRCARITLDAEQQRFEPLTAEIAAWDDAGVWHDFGSDTVSGWNTPDEVLRFMNMIAAL